MTGKKKPGRLNNINFLYKKMLIKNLLYAVENQVLCFIFTSTV